MPMRERWDIFCTVIDNYGDIGVCWRLARQLAAEQGFDVRLWVDDLASFQRLCPELDPRLSEQCIQNVCLRHWPTPLHGLNESADEIVVADVVIEAFACELPQVYLAAMIQRSPPPVWINLEYLSAESWVADCHGLASPHPQHPLSKHFYFPGFSTRTGGLLREADLLARRDAWQAQSRSLAARAHFNLPPAEPDECLISLFCYENPNLPALLHAWNDGEIPVRCLVPQGKALDQILSHYHHLNLTAGKLHLHPLPFVRQEDYDLLLWTCDLNFVRGEDSFVRALWSGRPLVWQIYPQEEQAHLIKLAAFLQIYADPSPLHALNNFWLCWNNASDTPIQEAWLQYLAHWQTHVRHAQHWSQQLAEQSGLVHQLVEFRKKLL